MAQMTEALAHAILAGDGITRNEVEQLCHFFLRHSADLARLTAELERSRRECEGLRADAERFRHLQNIDKKEAQAFFWHFESRKQRAKAIDAAMEAAK